MDYNNFVEFYSYSIEYLFFNYYNCIRNYFNISLIDVKVLRLISQMVS